MIKDNVQKLLSVVPENIIIEAACKTRTSEEIQEAVNAGIKVLGQNYVQEAESTYPKISGDVRWHFIGHLQKNKVRKAVKIFNMVESLDSVSLAEELDKRCRQINKIMDCLVEVNSGEEEGKFGVCPTEVEKFIESVSHFENIRIMGLMTMGALMGNPEDFRSYFKTTREIFLHLKNKNIKNCRMEYLSMGMSASYEVAIEEGANIVRIGTKIFGPRN